MWLVDLNYIFECDWLIKLSDNKLSNNKLSNIIIQQIVTLSKYGHDALDIRHP